MLKAGWGSALEREGKKEVREGRRRGEERWGGAGVLCGWSRCDCWRRSRERESVLRPDCLPSGEKLCQHPLKWPASEKILCRVEAIRASRNSLAVIKVTELLRHRHAPLLSSYFQKSDFIQSGGQQKHVFKDALRSADTGDKLQGLGLRNHIA